MRNKSNERTINKSLTGWKKLVYSLINEFEFSRQVGKASRKGKVNKIDDFTTKFSEVYKETNLELEEIHTKKVGKLSKLLGLCIFRNQEGHATGNWGKLL